MIEHRRKRRKTATLRLVYTVRNYIPTAEEAKAVCNVGSVASGHTVRVPGMSVAGLCATFASTIKWHRTSLRGGPLWPPCLVKKGSF